MVNPGGSSQPPAVGTGSLSWKRCAGCGGKIADRFLLYTMESYWHSRCLKCSCCQAQLGEIGTSCYTKSGMILCRNDYIRWDGRISVYLLLLTYITSPMLFIKVKLKVERLFYLFFFSQTPWKEQIKYNFCTLDFIKLIFHSHETWRSPFLGWSL